MMPDMANRPKDRKPHRERRAAHYSGARLRDRTAASMRNRACRVGQADNRDATLPRGLNLMLFILIPTVAVCDSWGIPKAGGVRFSERVRRIRRDGGSNDGGGDDHADGRHGG